MAFYHDVITEKSWEELQALKRLIPFVLIGGWAVYLYTKALKSKDIDIIIDFDQLPVLEKNYVLTKNNRLKKYEARKGSVEIDVYLPHFSELGIPVADLLQKKTAHEGFSLVERDVLIALKIFTLSQRGEGPKGEKDFIDIMSLFHMADASSDKVCQVLKQYRLEKAWEPFLKYLGQYTALPELHWNAHQFSKIKKKIKSSIR